MTTARNDQRHRKPTRAPRTLIGRPLIFSEHLAALGTVGDILLADFSYYLIRDRMAMTMDASPRVNS